MHFLEGFLLGALGGVVTEIHGLYQLRKRFHKRRPGWVRSTYYWLSTAAMSLVGGIVVALYLHSGIALSPLLAVHLGAATPTFIGSLSQSFPSNRTDT